MPKVDQATAVHIRAEIRGLRGGRGVFAPDLMDRMGPHLWALCGVHHDASGLRRTLIQQLLACSAALRPDHQDVLVVSLAIDAETQGLTRFKDRVGHLAGKLSVSTRTAQRRIDDAEAELADEIAAVLSANGSGPRVLRDYYVRRYRTIVDNTSAHTDSATVVVHQEREIVCVQPGLAEVPIRLELPDHPDTPEPLFTIRVLHGGRITTQRRISPTGFEYILGLPSALAQRQSHGFGLAFTFPAHLIRAHHVITGEVTIREYTLIVRFHPDRPPVWFRKVDGEDVRTLDAFARRDTPPYGEFPLNAVGEAELTFDRLSPHLAYGCQYRWPEASGGDR